MSEFHQWNKEKRDESYYQNKPYSRDIKKVIPPKIELVPPKGPNVLEEANELIYGERQVAYGSPLAQYTKLAELWSALVGVKITAEQAVLMMAGLKLVRAFDQAPDPEKEGLTKHEKEKHRDSIVDLAGYSGVIGKIEEERGWWK